jgi:hypothetical protein
MGVILCSFSISLLLLHCRPYRKCEQIVLSSSDGCLTLSWRPYTSTITTGSSNQTAANETSTDGSSTSVLPSHLLAGPVGEHTHFELTNV